MVTRHPSIESLFRQGLESHRQGNLQQASDLYSRILAIKPDFTPAMNNIALIARDMGRLDLAYNMLRESLRFDSSNLETLANVSLVALQNRDFNGAEHYLRQALQRKPDQQDLRMKLGMALYGQNKLEDAAKVFRALLKQQPNNFDLLYNLGVIAVREGRVDEALDFFQQSLKVRPGDIGALNQIAEQYLLRRELDQADLYLQLSLATSFMNNRALALQAVLLNHRGDAAALKKLYAWDNLFNSAMVEVSENFGSIEEFNRQLIACLDQQVKMEQDPPGQATVNGLHSATITHIQDPAMLEMNRLIGLAFAAAAKQAETLTDHPYPVWLPKRQILDSWTIRLRTGGFQRPHTHPRAWLSGVYYVQVPEEIHDSANAQSGWIEFGRPDEKYGVKDALECVAQEPVAGKLVTFPSYFWHHTLPFSSEQERISLAFDICPA